MAKLNLFNSIKFLGIVLLAFAMMNCKQQQQKDKDKLEELRKDFWSNDGMHDASTDKAVKLDSAYKAYTQEYPDDTLTPEYLWEDANLHVNILKNPDQGLVLLQQLFTKYPEHRRSPEAIFQTAFIFETTLQKPKLATKNYEYLISKYPDHPFAKQAQMSLKYVGKDPSLMLQDILDSSKKNADTVAKQTP